MFDLFEISDLLEVARYEYPLYVSDQDEYDMDDLRDTVDDAWYSSRGI